MDEAPVEVALHVRQRRVWLRVAICLLLAALLACAVAVIYDQVTVRSMREEAASTLRDPETGIVLGAEPQVYAADGERACLLLHGFSSSPADFGTLGRVLQAQGVHAFAPLLPGHGRSPADLRGTRCDDWTRAAEEAFDSLAARFDSVAVVGFSMGGALALHLARARSPRRVVVWGAFFRVTHKWHYVLPLEWSTRLIVPIVRYVRKAPNAANVNDKAQIGKFPFYRHFSTRASLELFALAGRVFDGAGGVTVPVLMLHSAGDETASPDAAREYFAALGSAEKDAVWYERSNHILGWDFDREAVVRDTVAFLAR
jgi:carboxylesterase